MIVDVAYPVRLGFAPASVAVPDPEHPGLRRAGPRAGAPYGVSDVELHACTAVDCDEEVEAPPDLLTFGFDAIDLSALTAVQEQCAAVRQAGRIEEEHAAAIRAGLQDAVVRTSSGRSLRVLHLAEEGFIMRTSGPNRMAVTGSSSSGMNGHGAATSVHADQDVFGTPLTQLMGGRAPELFRHDSPDGHNHDASLLLVNLWIPLQQIVQPLVLADGRSIDRRRHQLRYGLATGSFLERDQELAINDIWSFLHHDDQRWYFRSDMDHRHAYVFNTLSTPHGAGTLPGEDVAERLYRTVETAEQVVAVGDVRRLVDLTSPARSISPPGTTTPALAEAIRSMRALLVEAADDPEAVCAHRAEAWAVAARAARRRVVRMSLELRLVVSLDV